MHNTIKSSSEISHVFDRGQWISTPDLTLIVLRYEGQHDHNGRVAFIAGKKLGNAVWRNKAKRRMRAICDELGGPYPQYDVVFMARKSVTSVPFNALKARTYKALKSAGTIRPRED